jgi:hypothetical protein
MFIFDKNDYNKTTRKMKNMITSSNALEHELLADIGRDNSTQDVHPIMTNKNANHGGFLRKLQDMSDVEIAARLSARRWHPPAKA